MLVPAPFAGEPIDPWRPGSGEHQRRKGACLVRTGRAQVGEEAVAEDIALSLHWRACLLPFAASIANILRVLAPALDPANHHQIVRAVAMKQHEIAVDVEAAFTDRGYTFNLARHRALWSSNAFFGRCLREVLTGIVLIDPSEEVITTSIPPQRSVTTSVPVTPFSH